MSDAAVMTDSAAARGGLAEITIDISGERLSGWQGLQIVRGIDQAADGFSFRVPFEATEENRLRFAAYRTNNVVVRHGGDPVITGPTEKLSAQWSGDGRELTIEGRSRSAAILEISAWPGEYRAPFDTLSYLLQVPKDQRKDQPPPAVVVTSDPEIMTRVTQVDPGQTVYEVLSKIAAGYGLWAQPQPDGSLLFRKIRGAPAGVELREAVAPLISIATTHDLTKRYHRYRVEKTIDGENYSAEAVDNGVDPILRPIKITEPEQDAEVAEAAKWAKSRGIIDGYTCKATVTGWTVGGKLWAPAMTIPVYAPSAMIYDTYELIVKRVTLQLDESGGAITELDLTFPEAFLGTDPAKPGQPPGRPYPWSVGF